MFAAARQVGACVAELRIVGLNPAPSVEMSTWYMAEYARICIFCVEVSIHRILATKLRKKSKITPSPLVKSC